ncbi:endonuclease/exonuclease/phosphatase family protein [Leeia aquatica]|uniref:Endonuclease/exonuclease/phosphatase n=1 Tax=Leeia aquatica TaxID=2725557 RepID=A0A847S9H3_9NEIS|nr:endonuclease/exonuclease/phosphatase family protein [Leeia aquatica]NLR74226.1 endonuclease/exonuclease/phosphatase [Leeia aquatica]
MQPLFLAFWNVENLFDLETAPRLDKLQKVIGKSLQGWDDAVLSSKLGQLSKVIRSLNEGKGPDALGVCEVESAAVLGKLCQRIATDGGRQYQVAHADSSDARGIDVAFLYDAQRMQAGATFQHWVVKRKATRDLLQVNFTVEGQPLVLIANHWPSRLGGQYESEPYRMTAGETLAYWHQRIQQELGPQVAVVAMGDFNDEPFNRSLQEYALAVNDRDTVLNGRNPYWLNLMWPLLATGQGSHYYDGWGMLDQMLVSKGVVNGQSGWRVETPCRIEGQGLMAQSNRQPHRFGLEPGKRDLNGFSDHFPVSLTLQRVG